MGAFIDLKGKRFGRWLVVKRDYNKLGKIPFWNCVCDCGVEKSVQGSNLRLGHTVSCGCYRDERSATLRSKRTFNKRLYDIWNNIKQRTSNIKASNANLYIGKGIELCNDWNVYDNFYDLAMNNGYSNKLTIDRIDGSKDYTPDNCRWTTQKVQSRNTSRNLIVTYKDVTCCFSELCEMYDVSYSTTYCRVYVYGWSLEDAIKKPKHVNNRRKT